MRAWQVEGAFGRSNLKQVDVEVKEPGRGEVAIEMRACSLNYRDLLVIDGLYLPHLPLPFTPVSDGVGRITALGPDSSRFEVGARVAGAFAPKWTAGPPTKDALRNTLGAPLSGMLRRHVVLPESWLVRIPDCLSDVEAATLPCAGVTAWSSLRKFGQVGPGDTVLTLGTGGVSVFVLQLAQVLGARVAITSSSDAKLERAKELGAAFTVNYRSDPHWGKTVKKWSGDGVDHVIEVGGPGTLSESLRAVRPGGQVSVIGVLSGTEGPLSLLPVLMNQLRLQGVMVGSVETFHDLLRVFEHHSVRPVVDKVFPFDEADRALAHLASGEHFGKVVIEI